MSLTFTHGYTLTRDGQEIDVELGVQVCGGRRATHLSPEEFADFEITATDQGGAPVELTEAEAEEIRDRCPEWAGEEYASRQMEYADARLDAMRDGD